MILKKTCTAAEIWEDLEALFHSNKDAKALQLDLELQNITLVPEKNLVMYAVNGLSRKFDHVAGIICHSRPLPSFLDTRSMLLHEEYVLSSQSTSSVANSSSHTVLVADQQHSNHGNRGGFNNRGGRHGGRGRGRGGGRGGGRWSNQTQQQHAPPGWGFGWYPLNVAGPGVLPSPHSLHQQQHMAQFQQWVVPTQLLQ
ncbi:unnamed protein product [Lactuca virosa]|uniref:Uncharacterized protein n=1 Tax=Lactuca virosa TaxID=75947 RepID=A0AAU9M8A4_9ASTR|nr:unnamed protein product [Lactuca virosa]